MLLTPLEQAVVGVGTGVSARQPLEPRILGQPKRKAILCPQLLEFGHHAVRHTRNALGQKTIHHTLVYLQLILDAEVDEVSVYEDVIGRP